MRYLEHTVDPHLTPYVRCIWELRGQRAAGEPAILERVLPDGCAELIFHLAQAFQCLQPDGSARRQERALFAGVSTRAILLQPSRDVDVVAVRFQPGGAVLLSDDSLAHFTDRIVPAATLALPGLEELHGRLSESAPGPSRVALLQRFLRPRMGDVRRGPLCAAAIAARGLGADSLLRATGLSARQLQRRFQNEVGIGPKRLQRIERLQRAVQLAQGPTRPSLTAVAQAAGYADQAHFSRDFRSFGGLSPGAFLRETHPLADALVGAPR